MSGFVDLYKKVYRIGNTDTESTKDLNKDSIISKTEFEESYYVQKIPQEHQSGFG